MKKPEDSQPLSNKWQQRFSIAKSNQTELFNRFSQWYDAFNARTDSKIAPWRSKPYMPIIAQQIWALVAKFSSLRPGFQVKVRDETLGDDDEQLEERANKAEQKLKYDYEGPYMDEPMRDKIASVMIDACVTGTGIAKVPYCSKINRRYERMIDEETGYADLSKQKVTEKRIGYNDFEPVNIFNVFVSPATDRLNRGWLIIRDFVAISDLKSTNEAKGGNFYQNLDKLSNKPAYKEFSQYNASRNRFSTEQEPKDDTTDTATTYECYEGDWIYLFGESKDPKSEEGWVLLRKTKNYYWHGKWPIVKFHVKKRPYSFWGQGLAELTYRLQIIFNDVFAHYLDGWNLTENPSFWIASDNDVNDFVIEPGSLNSYNGQTPPTPIAFNKPDPGALQMIVGLLQQSIEGVTASQYAVGLPNSNADNTKGTKGGIEKLTDAAGDIIGYMRENLTASILTVGKMWHSNNQQFLQQPVPITVTDKGTRKNVMVAPEDLKGEAEIYIDSASMEPKSDEEKRDNILGLTQQLLQMQQASMAQQQVVGTDPLIVNFQDLTEDIGEGFGYNNISNILMTQEQVDQMLVEKGEKMAQEVNNEAAGLPADPNEAAMQMTQELMEAGAVDPMELKKEMNNNGDGARIVETAGQAA